MVLFEWSEAISVNIREIDEQHKKLIAIIQALYDSIAGGKGQEAWKAVINDLIEYTAYHFRTEEDYFRKYEYPEQKFHTEEHELFTKQVIELKKKFEKGQVIMSMDFFNFLTNWLNNHILKVDKKYSLFFNDRGLF
jgi:hemerythrin